MRVICKCCFRPFDYDMYMGLCPKCGRVYRREKGMYSEVEKDMVGDFHLHAEDGGLNRGIDGVVYNQPGSVADKNKKNGFDEDFEERHYRPVSVPGAAANQAASRATASSSAAGTFSQRQAAIQQKAAMSKNASQYYSPNHKTQLNKSITEKKNGNGGVAFLIFIIFIIIGYAIRYFD
ncbi:MAG: hypothetical protein IKS48_05780 [Eubacterium sp.]|nr:hypothetical protein [Eubacterium sp.]